jgi:hypothetical protein
MLYNIVQDTNDLYSKLTSLLLADFGTLAPWTECRGVLRLLSVNILWYSTGYRLHLCAKLTLLFLAGFGTSAPLMGGWEVLRSLLVSVCDVPRGTKHLYTKSMMCVYSCAVRTICGSPSGMYGLKYVSQGFEA